MIVQPSAVNKCPCIDWMQTSKDRALATSRLLDLRDEKTTSKTPTIDSAAPLAWWSSVWAGSECTTILKPAHARLTASKRANFFRPSPLGFRQVDQHTSAWNELTATIGPWYKSLHGTSIDPTVKAGVRTGYTVQDGSHNAEKQDTNHFFFRPTPLGFRQVVQHVQLHVA